MWKILGCIAVLVTVGGLFVAGGRWFHHYYKEPEERAENNYRDDIPSSPVSCEDIEKASVERLTSGSRPEFLADHTLYLEKRAKPKPKVVRFTSRPLKNHSNCVWRVYLSLPRSMSSPPKIFLRTVYLRRREGDMDFRYVASPTPGEYWTFEIPATKENDVLELIIGIASEQRMPADIERWLRVEVVR